LPDGLQSDETGKMTSHLHSVPIEGPFAAGGWLTSITMASSALAFSSSAKIK
jgi:hypothetical protein